jgi:hypothetical protein
MNMTTSTAPQTASDNPVLAIPGFATAASAELDPGSAVTATISAVDIRSDADDFSIDRLLAEDERQTSEER